MIRNGRRGNSLLPAGWRLQRLDEVCEFLDSRRQPVKEPDRRFRIAGKSESELYPYYGANGRAGWIDDYLFDEPLILLAEDGGAFGSASRPIAYAVEGRCWVNNHAHVLRPREGVDFDFCLYSLAIRPDVGELVTGNTRPKLNQAIAASILIPLPPLAEQKRIAGILKEQLAAVERARAAAQAQLEAAQALPAAYLQEVFPLRGSRGEFVAPLTAAPLTQNTPTAWQWHLLRDLATLESGHTPSRYRPEWWGGDVPWLALPDIRELDGKVAQETCEHTNEDGIANSSARVLPKGTVCLSRTASVGFVTIMGRPMATSQDFVNWVCGPSLDPCFLMHLLIASRDYIRSVSSGAVHKTVYVPTVKEFKVCVPEITRQRALAARLTSQIDEAERTIGLITAQLDMIDSLPAALLRVAFQGKL